MKQFDTKAWADFEEKNNKATFLTYFGGAVRKELEKCAIKYRFETKDHKFGDGETGQIAKKLVIEIDFKDSVIQPHDDFEAEFCGQIADVLQGEINGLFENYETLDS